MAKRKLIQRHHSKKIGLPPGSYIFTGEQKMQVPEISVIFYGSTGYKNKSFQTIEEALTLIASTKEKFWLNIVGLHDVTLLDHVTSIFDIHRLTGEDILNVGQRAKLEDFNHYLQVVVKMWSGELVKSQEEQVSLLLFKQGVVTFQEKTGDVFEGVRGRLESGKGTIRSRGADYLLYALLDALVDDYFILLENVGDQMEQLEEEVLFDANENKLKEIHELRRKMQLIRRSIYPLREVIGMFQKIDSDLIERETKLFVRDLYDHVIQVIETLEVQREVIVSLLDLYMNTVSNKMNNVMKVLTIIATIFIPLTFIAGVYGMNFDHMPELHWENGYFISLLIMAILAVLMVIYFKKKKWF